jgi:hypothetical protein
MFYQVQQIHCCQIKFENIQYFQFEHENHLDLQISYALVHQHR